MQTAWTNQPGIEGGYLFDANGRLLTLMQRNSIKAATSSIEESRSERRL